MSSPASIDTTLNLMLSELRLPTIKALWPQFTAQADREGWPRRASVDRLDRARNRRPCPASLPAPTRRSSFPTSANNSACTSCRYHKGTARFSLLRGRLLPSYAD